MITTLWAIGLGLAVGGAVVGLLLHRRHRRQMQALGARLEILEARWMAETGAAEPPATLASAGAGPELPDDTITPTGDVLAGLTTHVQRLVARGGAASCLADQAILAIYQRLGDNVTPAMTAEALHVSLRTLERGLAVALECTPSQLVVAVKMREARRMLAGEGMRVAEVAERLGFANPFHFSRRFKAFYGVAPSELRAEAAAARTASTRKG
jgi:AraC-like DNA-binding protein